MIKNNKKIPKEYMSTHGCILYSKLAPLNRDVTCSKL